MYAWALLLSRVVLFNFVWDFHLVLGAQRSLHPQIIGKPGMLSMRDSLFKEKVFNLFSHPEGWELKVINSLGDLCYLKGQDRLDDPYTICIARAFPKLPQPRLKMTDSQNGLCAIRMTKIMETLFYSQNPSSWKK